MDGKRKRPRFKFHLLTAVMMMVTAGAVLGLNIRDRDGMRGWPCDMSYPLIVRDSEEGTIEIAEQTARPHRMQFNPTGLLADVLVAIAILAAIAFVSESILRRREARKS